MMQSVRGVDQHLWSLGRSPFDSSTRAPNILPYAELRVTIEDSDRPDAPAKTETI